MSASGLASAESVTAGADSAGVSLTATSSFAAGVSTFASTFSATTSSVVSSTATSISSSVTTAAAKSPRRSLIFEALPLSSRKK